MTIPSRVQGRALLSTAFWRETIPEAEHWRLSSPAGPLFPPGTDIAQALEAFILPRRGARASATHSARRLACALPA